MRALPREGSPDTRCIISGLLLRAFVSAYTHVRSRVCDERLRFADFLPVANFQLEPPPGSNFAMSLYRCVLRCSLLAELWIVQSQCGDVRCESVAKSLPST